MCLCVFRQSSELNKLRSECNGLMKELGDTKNKLQQEELQRKSLEVTYKQNMSQLEVHSPIHTHNPAVYTSWDHTLSIHFDITTSYPSAVYSSLWHQHTLSIHFDSITTSHTCAVYTSLWHHHTLSIHTDITTAHSTAVYTSWDHTPSIHSDITIYTLHDVITPLVYTWAARLWQK